MSRTQRTGLKSGIAVLFVMAALAGWTRARSAEAQTTNVQVVQQESSECYLANGKQICRVF
jgi:hypothetical protein